MKNEARVRARAVELRFAITSIPRAPRFPFSESALDPRVTRRTAYVANRRCGSDTASQRLACEVM
jgi:hypothetical protein